MNETVVARAENFKSGFISLTGRPNVGKSTLLNRLVAQKVAIISEKPQTTRHKITGVKTTEAAQMVFIDTPGIHEPKSKLGTYMVKVAREAYRDADLVVFITDESEDMPAEDQNILSSMRELKCPTLLIINKIDLMREKQKLLTVIDRYNKAYPFSETLAVSALTGENIGELEQTILKYLPCGPKYFPDDFITDQPLNEQISELIREKAIDMTRQEIPHAIAVDVEHIHEMEPGKLHIEATIYVEKDSQKGIIIGKDGAMIKNIGQMARQEIERKLNAKLFLKLWVKVKKKWRNDESALRLLGYH